MTLTNDEIEALFQDVTLYCDQDTMRGWAQDILARGLYREDGLAQDAFRGQYPLYAMSYMPGVAWVAYHGSRFGPRIIGSVFVRPSLRRRGIGRRYAKLIHEIRILNTTF